MTIKIICVDADDTLWHNMRHFNEAFAAFRDLLSEFAEADVSQAMLNEAENRNRHVYGYGAKTMTLSMIETAIEITGDAFPRSMAEEILRVGRSLLTHPVELLDGIDVTLRALADRGGLILVTKGDLLHQEIELAASGLGDLFSGVRIVSDKMAETFRSIIADHGIDPHEGVLAGDSMRSDVLPAVQAGAFAAYIPREGAWVHERAEHRIGPALPNCHASRI